MVKLGEALFLLAYKVVVLFLSPHQTSRLAAMQAFFVLRKSVALSGFVSPAETSHTQPATALLKLPEPARSLWEWVHPRTRAQPVPSNTSSLVKGGPLTS